MSNNKFRLTKTGEVFIYDNTINAILDAEGRPVSAESDLLAGLPSYHKDTNPHTIKVILGHACNYSCSYCVQKDIGNPAERPKNIMTKNLINKIKQHLDLDKLNRIELWGGETLLYWSDIVEIMTALDNPAITWYIPTNGTILKLKHAEFFKQLKGKVTIGISHDGPGHESLRGPEFLHRKVDELRALQKAGVKFSFNAVISTTNYDLFAIDSYFRTFLHSNQLDPVGLVFELGRTYETGACATESHVITGEQIPEYRAILKAYLKRQSNEMGKRPDPSKLLKSSLFHFGNGVLPYATSFRHQNPIHHYSSCGTDQPGLITLDMNGNLRTCQNTNEDYIYGSLETISTASMKKMDYDKNDFCRDCSVLRLCNRSCPIALPFETFIINHQIENAHYTEIQLAAFEILFNSPVEKVE